MDKLYIIQKVGVIYFRNICVMKITKLVITLYFGISIYFLCIFNDSNSTYTIYDNLVK